jgi:exosortase
VVREGHTLLLNGNVHVAVAEACSGLRMLTAFVVVAWVLAYIIHRSPWQKAVLVVSSIPVAILCNIVRLVITAMLFMVTTAEFAEQFFHDFAGLTMMPLAILMLLGELWVMSQIVIEEEPGERAPAGL